MAGQRDIGGWTRLAALCHHITGASFALTALRRHTQLELNIVKTHTGAGMAGDFAVRDPAADTDDHGEPLKVGGFDKKLIINENRSYLQ